MLNDFHPHLINEHIIIQDKDNLVAGGHLLQVLELEPKIEINSVGNTIILISKAGNVRKHVQYLNSINTNVFVTSKSDGTI